MQDSDAFDLFGPVPPPPSSTPPRVVAPPPPSKVEAAAPLHCLREWADQLPAQLRMGVSTWSYPGWEGLVWNGSYDASVLSRHGLSALAQHPLMRTVCVDRTFWRPLSTEQYAAMAAQVPEDFRFVVKCPSSITDATVRGESGQARSDNPVFLEPDLALKTFAHPALAGLQQWLGVLVYQLSPLPWPLLSRPTVLLQRLEALLRATRGALESRPPRSTPVIVAVEVRDPELLTPDLARTLRQQGATYCLGLHGKMPSIEAQLPILRALWPGPLVCRWNLNRVFGPYGYPEAQEKHAPFDTIRSPDPETLSILARTIKGITDAGQPAFVTISNDAEGCAPLSIARLAEQLAAMSSAENRAE